jgi:signal transduction histidine kinase
MSRSTAEEPTVTTATSTMPVNDLKTGLSNRTLQLLSWGSLAFYVGGIAASGVAELLDKTVVEDWGSSGSISNAMCVAMTALFPIVGILIIRKQPRNVVGWMLHGTGIAWGLTGWFEAFERLSINIVPSIPGGEASEVISQMLWWPPILMMAVYTIIFFPDGRLPSPRWRWLPWVAGIDCALGALVAIITPGKVADVVKPLATNPLALPVNPHVTTPIFYTLLAILPLSLLAAAASVFVRFRRSTGVERVQVKWLLYAVAFIATIYATTIFSSQLKGDNADPGWLLLLQNISLLAFGLIPITIGIAITRYGLYEIDALISRTLLVGTLGVFITGVYVGIVVGVGALIGQQHPSVWLSVIATALVAVAFQPAREALKKGVNRLVYGSRATPYEVLSNFASSMAGRYTTGELLPRIAQTVSACLGGARVQIWLSSGRRMVREAQWPQDESDTGGASVNLADSGDLSSLEADRVVPVRHRGEVLGAIAVSRSGAEPVTPTEDEMLDHVASQTGLVLRNLRLVDDLQSSRQRLVTSQDTQRRRLERDLHDGAQQSLVAITLMLRMASNQKDSESLKTSIGQAADQLQAAIAELRELARGIHPAILTDRGLGPAVGSLVERCPIPVEVHNTVGRRLPGPVEGTLYFVVAESLTNIAKYAHATRVSVTLQDLGETVTLEVVDDGVGGANAGSGSGLLGLADRVSVVNGTFTLHSPPGEGTRVGCVVPVPPAAVDGPSAPATPRVTEPAL